MNMKRGYVVLIVIVAVVMGVVLLVQGVEKFQVRRGEGGGRGRGAGGEGFKGKGD